MIRFNTDRSDVDQHSQSGNIELRVDKSANTQAGKNGGEEEGNLSELLETTKRILQSEITKRILKSSVATSARQQESEQKGTHCAAQLLESEVIKPVTVNGNHISAQNAETAEKSYQDVPVSMREGHEPYANVRDPNVALQHCVTGVSGRIHHVKGHDIEVTTVAPVMICTNFTQDSKSLPETNDQETNVAPVKFSPASVGSERSNSNRTPLTKQLLKVNLDQAVSLMTGTQRNSTDISDNTQNIRKPEKLIIPRYSYLQLYTALFSVDVESI